MEEYYFINNLSNKTIEELTDEMLKFEKKTKKRIIKHNTDNSDASVCHKIYKFIADFYKN